MSGIFVVLYAMNVLQTSALEFGFLVSLRVLTCAVFAVPAAKLADRAGQASRRPFVALSYLFMAASSLALVLVPSAGWLAVAFVLTGLFDACEAPRKSLIMDLTEGAGTVSDRPGRGSVMGVYHLIRGAAVFPASFIGGWLWESAPRAPFLVGAGVTGLGLLWFLLLGPRTARKVGTAEGPDATLRSSSLRSTSDVAKNPGDS